MAATANWTWTMYPGLSKGAINTIIAHGSDEMKEKWLSAPDQAPFAQLIAMAKNFPDLQARTEDDVFLTPGNMALTERTVLASRPFGTPDEDYVAVAKDDDTGVRSSTFSFRSAI